MITILAMSALRSLRSAVISRHGPRRRLSSPMALLLFLLVVAPAPMAGAAPGPPHVLLTASGAHKSYQVTYDYTCCSWKLVNTVYHPGSSLTIHWIEVPDSSPPHVKLRIWAAIIGPFSSAASSMDATMNPSPGSGHIKVSARAIVVSNSTPLRLVSVIHIPKSAKPGFYNLVTGSVWLDGSGSGYGGSAIRIAK